MNVKEKFMRFWTLSKNRKGFTLVELIVVIAILAILAGVAIPVYNGYIKKAESAADQQVLDSINTAYAAACLSEGVNHEEVVASVTIDANGLICQNVNNEYVYAISVTDAKGAGADAIVDNFAMFYAGNETAAFKSEQFCGKTFLLPITEGGAASGDRTIALPGGGTLSLTEAQYQSLKESTYSKDIGGLFTKVDEMGGLVNALMGATGNAGTALNNFKGSKEYLTNIITALGGTVDPDASVAELQTLYNNTLRDYKENQVINAIAEATGKNPEDVNIMGADSDLYEQLSGSINSNIDDNVLILGVAQSAANATKEGALDIINSDNPKQLLIDTMLGKDTSANGMGNAALVYGMFTAYAKSDAATDTAKDAVENGGATAVFNVLNGEELKAFQSYLESDQGIKDADACVTAMQAINSTAGNADAAQGLINKGFADADLIAELEKLFK